MTLPAINYETIKGNEEFKSFLEKKYNKWYKYLRFYNFNIDVLPLREKQRLFEIYKLFVEKKENWFPAKRASKTKPPIIKRETIKSWLRGRILFYHAPGNSKFAFERSFGVIADKATERLLPIFEDIAVKFPTMINILIQNTNTKFVIVQSNIEINSTKESGKNSDLKGKTGGAMEDNFVILKEEDIFNEKEEAIESLFRHEIYHLLDSVAVDTSLPLYASCRQTLIGYVEVLNERLRGKLDEIAKKESKKMLAFNLELKKSSQICEQIEDINKAFEYLKLNIKFLSEKHYVWMPVMPRTATIDGKEYIGVVNAEYDLNAIEIFAYGLEAYFKNKENLKRYNKELFDIIENEILLDLR